MPPPMVVWAISRSVWSSKTSPAARIWAGSGSCGAGLGPQVATQWVAANAGEAEAAANRRAIAILVFITVILARSSLWYGAAAQIVSVESSTRERGPSTTTIPLSVT